MSTYRSDNSLPEITSRGSVCLVCVCVSRAFRARVRCDIDVLGCRDVAWGSFDSSLTGKLMHRPLSVLRVLILVVTCATGSVEARGSSLGPTAVWLLESCVSIGSVKLGLPGVAAQFFFASPIPTIRDVIRTGYVFTSFHVKRELPALSFTFIIAPAFLVAWVN
eukprot:m.211270 g.211270  ORF g.211270 m.211270 type:complete len:164 (-) comp15491_c0_seq7:1116-1607(-)